ncbi:hypothetical protein SSP35_02_03430 [Streptomyces sp. NBRC 110611]|uniref:hypothetical protein n=1 Tax=Streptomyces sp. NBRC 110611 TaxID=1621259 RepID=UPI0008300436|nr:hypothetical protein [Streptomyces sp. NBRC 110611]GAU65974.1 hypothetical protein SSP35_02_03430 [Streptomyces sp. NBRC 110611]
MNNELMHALDEAWDPDTGFLGKLRDGIFDRAAGAEYVQLLGRVAPFDGMVDSELVRLIWFAPMFTEWQIDRAARTEEEKLELSRISDRIQEKVMEIIGVP